MKVVIAIDSFKGSLSSMQAGNAAKMGIINVFPQAEVVVRPLADGGEGTLEALAEGMNGLLQTATVNGPLGESVQAQYVLLPSVGTAVLEMAQTSGLPQVPLKLRDPRKTTTYGLGELIRLTIRQGYRNFIIGIGGSATNDAGIGMLSALGFEFLDSQGRVVKGVGADLINITSINKDNAMPELADCTFKIACDVNNPLYGTNGAAYIYGPQKGATPQIVQELDQGLQHFASIAKQHLSKDFANLPGAGAAGGLGYAFVAFLNGKLEPGINLIMQEIGLATLLHDADFVITGEGCLDGQTAMGKAPLGVAKMAQKHGVKVIALAGCTTDDAVKCNTEGIDAYFSVLNAPMSLKEAMCEDIAYKNIVQTVRQIFNLIKCLEKNNKGAVMMIKDNTTSQPAAEYDANITKTIPYYKIIQEESLRVIGALKPNPDSWLDAGCGTGNLAAQAIGLFKDCKFSLSDPSESMLNIAKDKLSAYDCRFLVGGTQCLPLESESFDVITACLAHHYSNKEDKIEILRNCYQALKPGGIYLTIETVLKDCKLATDTGVELWRLAQIKAGKSEEAANKHVSRLGSELAPITLCEHFELMKAAGFTVVELYWVSGMQAAFYAVK